MLVLTWLVLHVRKNMTPARPNSEARQVSERSFWANFVFLQLTLFCKLITAVIILIHVCGLTSNSMPISTLRLFYNGSGLFMCIAYFIMLYQWVFIAMRVNLYGGKFGVRVFKKRVKKSKLTNNAVGWVIFSTTLALILLEVFYPVDQVGQAVTMVEIVEFTTLLLCFTITGSLIIRNLWVYFDKTYNCQRHSLLAALLLTILSLLVLQLRYILEFVYNGQQVQISTPGDADPDSKKAQISITVCLCVILISDLLPIVTQMLCIWIACKGKWHDLISGFLHKPNAGDTSTYAGSCMLDALRNELARDMQSDQDFNFLNDLDSKAAILAESSRVIKFNRQTESFDNTLFKANGGLG